MDSLQPMPASRVSAAADIICPGRRGPDMTFLDQFKLSRELESAMIITPRVAARLTWSALRDAIDYEKGAGFHNDLWNSMTHEEQNTFFRVRELLDEIYRFCIHASAPARRPMSVIAELASRVPMAEVLIAERLVVNAIESGFILSVSSGGIFVCGPSTDPRTVLDSLAEEAFDWVYLFTNSGERVCAFCLIWGNGQDLISDEIAFNSFKGSDDIAMEIAKFANFGINITA